MKYASIPSFKTKKSSRFQNEDFRKATPVNGSDSPDKNTIVLQEADNKADDNANYCTLIVLPVA